MNRRYTRAHYMALVEKIRKAVPQIFYLPILLVSWRNRKDFNDTVDVVKQCRFNKAFIAQYSERKGAASCLFADNVSAITKKKRWEILNALINH